MMPLILSVMGLTLVARPAAAESPKPEIVVYAAASLRDALEALTDPCERETGAKLVLNLGASSDLERQIEAGNKADLFFSADEAWMDKLDTAGLVDGATRRSPLSNHLVVVALPDGGVTVKAPSDLASRSIRRVSIANPDAVPAGKYARVWLQKAGLWESIADRVLPGVDVRAALAAVEAGGAEVGIVYRTDARVSKKVQVVYEVPESESPAISYALAAMKDRPQAEAARLVVTFLAGPAAAPVYERFGFLVKTSPR